MSENSGGWAQPVLGNAFGLWHHYFRMSITATVENDSIKPPPGVHPPDGAEVRIEPPSGPRTIELPEQTLAERYAEFIGVWEDGPADLAAEHNYYACGTPKRSSR